MCLGIPMRVVKIDGAEGFVEAGGLKKRADLSMVRGIKVGDYILMHAGFAIEKVKEAEARKTLNALEALQ